MRISNRHLILIAGTCFGLILAAGFISNSAGLGLKSQDTPVLVLNAAQQEYTLGRYIEYLEDDSRALTIEQVSSPEFDPLFTRGDQDVLNFGFRDSAYWVRLHVRNEAPAETQWLLELAEPPMNSVILYSPRAGMGAFTDIKTGYIYPMSSRDVPDESFVFRMAIEPDTEATYYLRV